MTLDGLTGPLAYAGILVAAVIEGEVAYVAAGTLVAAGQLNAAGVVLAGATGAAIGDQFYFYALRGRLPRWARRVPALERRAAPLVARVRRHDTAMVFLIRFAPGLRVALAAARAYAAVSPLKFTVVDSLSALLWAVLVLALVAHVGPASLGALGLSGWEAAVCVGLVVIAVLQAIGWVQRRMLVPHAPPHGAEGADAAGR